METTDKEKQPTVPLDTKHLEQKSYERKKPIDGSNETDRKNSSDNVQEARNDVQKSPHKLSLAAERTYENDCSEEAMITLENDERIDNSEESLNCTTDIDHSQNELSSTTSGVVSALVSSSAASVFSISSSLSLSTSRPSSSTSASQLSPLISHTASILSSNVQAFLHEDKQENKNDKSITNDNKINKTNNQQIGSTLMKDQQFTITNIFEKSLNSEPVKSVSETSSDRGSGNEIKNRGRDMPLIGDDMIFGDEQVLLDISNESTSNDSLTSGSNNTNTDCISVNTGRGGGSCPDGSNDSGNLNKRKRRVFPIYNEDELLKSDSDEEAWLKTRKVKLMPTTESELITPENDEKVNVIYSKVNNNLLEEERGSESPLELSEPSSLATGSANLVSLGLVLTSSSGTSICPVSCTTNDTTQDIESNLKKQGILIDLEENSADTVVSLCATKNDDMLTKDSLRDTYMDNNAEKVVPHSTKSDSLLPPVNNVKLMNEDKNLEENNVYYDRDLVTETSSTIITAILSPPSATTNVEITNNDNQMPLLVGNNNNDIINSTVKTKNEENKLCVNAYKNSDKLTTENVSCTEKLLEQDIGTDLIDKHPNDDKVIGTKNRNVSNNNDDAVDDKKVDIDGKVSSNKGTKIIIDETIKSLEDYSNNIARKTDIDKFSHNINWNLATIDASKSSDDDKSNDILDKSKNSKGNPLSMFQFNGNYHHRSSPLSLPPSTASPLSSSLSSSAESTASISLTASFSMSLPTTSTNVNNFTNIVKIMDKDIKRCDYESDEIENISVKKEITNEKKHNIDNTTNDNIKLVIEKQGEHATLQHSITSINLEFPIQQQTRTAVANQRINQFLRQQPIEVAMDGCSTSLLPQIATVTIAATPVSLSLTSAASVENQHSVHDVAVKEQSCNDFVDSLEVNEALSIKINSNNKPINNWLSVDEIMTGGSYSMSSSIDSCTMSSSASSRQLVIVDHLMDETKDESSRTLLHKSSKYRKRKLSQESSEDNNSNTSQINKSEDINRNSAVEKNITNNKYDSKCNMEPSKKQQRLDQNESQLKESIAPENHIVDEQTRTIDDTNKSPMVQNDELQQKNTEANEHNFSAPENEAIPYCKQDQTSNGIDIKCKGSATSTSLLKLALEQQRKQCSSERKEVDDMDSIKTVNTSLLSLKPIQSINENDETYIREKNVAINDKEKVKNNSIFCHTRKKKVHQNNVITNYKCTNCGKGLNLLMQLKYHQNVECLPSIYTKFAQTQQSHSRAGKVLNHHKSINKQNNDLTIYKCSTCGSCYEAWNIFFHILEQHGRHMCLYCSQLFLSAEKLALHLELRHDLEQNHFNTEDMLRESNTNSKSEIEQNHSPQQNQHKKHPSCYKANDINNSDYTECYLICCTCQHIFHEKEAFSQHDCNSYIKQCFLCGQKIYAKRRHICAFENQNNQQQKMNSFYNKMPETVNNNHNSIHLNEISAITRTSEEGNVITNERKNGVAPVRTYRNIWEHTLLNLEHSQRRYPSVQSPTNSSPNQHGNNNGSFNNSMLRDAVRNDELQCYEENKLQQHQGTDSQRLSFEKNNRDYEAIIPTPTETGIVDTASSSILKLTVPKLKLRVPKEFQKPVDAVLSTSESEEGWDGVSGETISNGIGVKEEKDFILPLAATSTNLSIEQSRMIGEIGTDSKRLNNGDFSGEMITENTDEYLKKIYEKQLNESMMKKLQHEHQPPGDNAAIVSLKDQSCILSSMEKEIEKNSGVPLDLEVNTNNHICDGQQKLKSSLSSIDGTLMNKDNNGAIGNKSDLIELDLMIQSNHELSPINNYKSDNLSSTNILLNNNSHFAFINTNISLNNDDGVAKIKISESSEQARQKGRLAENTSISVISENEHIQELTRKVLEPINGMDSAGKILSNDFLMSKENILNTDLKLDRKLSDYNSFDFVRLCLNTLYPHCLYCNHARRIAVNGKSYILHLLSNHRLKGVVSFDTAEVTNTEHENLEEKQGEFYTPEMINEKLNLFLNELDMKYLNLYKIYHENNNRTPIALQSSVTTNIDNIENQVETKSEKNSSIGTLLHERIFECMQCRFVAESHKDLYQHNRKIHMKTSILCIMCRMHFLTFTEVLCHMCPGIITEETTLNLYNLKYRCCLCNLEQIPSSFRLMVHLRKHHTACDICLEICYDQNKLSSHIWKHKLYHYCYRCGISYRNKPDITNHLFWKHGTESTVCKQCTKKRWPHVYHFCVPPAQFPCDVCQLNFTKAMYLRVHKRLHSGDWRYECNRENCNEKFVSRRLLDKHYINHDVRKTEEEIVDTSKITRKGKTKIGINNSFARLNSVNLKGRSVTTSKKQLSNSKQALRETSMERSRSTSSPNMTHPTYSEDNDYNETKKEEVNKLWVDGMPLIPPNLSESSDSSDSDSDSQSCNSDSYTTSMQLTSNKAGKDSSATKSVIDCDAQTVLILWKDLIISEKENESNINNNNNDIVYYRPKYMHTTCSDHDYSMIKTPPKKIRKGRSRNKFLEGDRASSLIPSSPSTPPLSKRLDAESSGSKISKSSQNPSRVSDSFSFLNKNKISASVISTEEDSNDCPNTANLEKATKSINNLDKKLSDSKDEYYPSSPPIRQLSDLFERRNKMLKLLEEKSVLPEQKGKSIEAKSSLDSLSQRGNFNNLKTNTESISLSDSNKDLLKGYQNKKDLSPVRNKEEDVSSSSDSSSSSNSCSCGSNCNCSSSSSDSSSSSSSSSDESGSVTSKASPNKLQQSNNNDKERRKSNSKSPPKDLEKSPAQMTPIRNRPSNEFDTTLAKNPTLKDDTMAQSLLDGPMHQPTTNDNENLLETTDKPLIKIDKKEKPLNLERKKVFTRRRSIQFHESDLETNESATDEDYYDENPQKLALEMWEKKRAELLALSTLPTPITDSSTATQTQQILSHEMSSLNSSNNITYKVPDLNEICKSKRSVRARKSSYSNRAIAASETNSNEQQNYSYICHSINNNIMPSTSNVLNVSTLQSQPEYMSAMSSANTFNNNQSLIPTTAYGLGITEQQGLLNISTSNSTGVGYLKRSQRKRRPNKFYGYNSSDDDASTSRQSLMIGIRTIKPQPPPNLIWCKEDLPTPSKSILRNRRRGARHSTRGARKRALSFTLNINNANKMTMSSTPLIDANISDTYPTDNADQLNNGRQSNQSGKRPNNRRRAPQKRLTKKEKLLMNESNDSLEATATTDGNFSPIPRLKIKSSTLGGDGNNSDTKVINNPTTSKSIKEFVGKEAARTETRGVAGLASEIVPAEKPSVSGKVLPPYSMDGDLLDTNSTASIRMLMMDNNMQRRAVFGDLTSTSSDSASSISSTSTESCGENSSDEELLLLNTSAAKYPELMRTLEQTGLKPKKCENSLLPATTSTTSSTIAASTSAKHLNNNNPLAVQRELKPSIPPALLPNPDFATLQYFKANSIRYPIRPPNGARRAREGESVYCYCRCPYDEVSEMIACDGENCVIEWFHFECVGILTAPKGRWFCPECRAQYQSDVYQSNVASMPSINNPSSRVMSSLSVETTQSGHWSSASSLSTIDGVTSFRRSHTASESNQ